MPTLKSAAAPRSIILKVLDPTRAKKREENQSRYFAMKLKAN
jgi:hypothetical protein